MAHLTFKQTRLSKATDVLNSPNLWEGSLKKNFLNITLQLPPKRGIYLGGLHLDWLGYHLTLLSQVGIIEVSCTLHSGKEQLPPEKFFILDFLFPSYRKYL